MKETHIIKYEYDPEDEANAWCGTVEAFKAIIWYSLPHWEHGNLVAAFKAAMVAMEEIQEDEDIMSPGCPALSQHEPTSQTEDSLGSAGLPRDSNGGESDGQESN